MSSALIKKFTWCIGIDCLSFFTTKSKRFPRLIKQTDLGSGGGGGGAEGNGAERWLGIPDGRFTQF